MENILDTVNGSFNHEKNWHYTNTEMNYIAKILHYTSLLYI